MEFSNQPLLDLFDLSFRKLITPQLIQVVYGIIVVLSCLGSVVLVGAAFYDGTVLGLLTLFIFAPLSLVAILAYSRFMLELILVLFRVVRSLDGKGSPSS